MRQTDQIFGKTNTMGILEQLAEIRRLEGLEEGREESVRLLLSNTEFSPGKIAELLGVGVSFVENIRKNLSAK